MIADSAQVQNPVDNLKVLSVRQPWASAMFFDSAAMKDIENRSWYTAYRGRIGIHAALQVDPVGLEFLGMSTEIPARYRGVLLGTVELLSIHKAGTHDCDLLLCSGNPWAAETPEDRKLFHWEIGHPRKFVTPIRATGRLGLWDAGPSLNHLAAIADVVTGLS
jgi:hypothetical protein